MHIMIVVTMLKLHCQSVVSYEFGCPSWIRTTIAGVRGQSPAVRRKGNILIYQDNLDYNINSQRLGILEYDFLYRDYNHHVQQANAQ